MLPYVSMTLLVMVAGWLIWPALADRLFTTSARGERKLAFKADGVAENLFDAWSEQDAKTSVRRGRARA